jgi:hypothetical protein
MAYIGTSPSQGVRHRYLFTATSGQTTFSGADDDSRTLSYTDTKFMDVFLNGVLLDPNSDYTATTGSSVVLTSGASTGDLLEVIAFDTFSVFSGTFGGDVTVGGAFTSQGIDDNASSTAVTIDSSNNVGIGTSSPDEVLEVSGDVKSSGGNFGIYHFGETSDVTKIVGRDAGHGSLPNVMDFFTNSTQRMRIDSSGNVQIGSTNSGVAGSLDVSIGSTSSSGGITLFSPTNGTHSLGFADGTSGTDRYRGYLEYQHASDAMTFGVQASEAMRIDSSPQVLMGKTVANLTTAGSLQAANATSDGSPAYFYMIKTFSGTRNAWLNYHSGTYVGGINMTNTSTSFPTSSDERLKKNIVDAPSAGDKIDAMQVRSFNWKADDSFQEYGLIAQELEPVYDLPVEQHDTEDTLTVDYSKLVPVLLKEIQDLRKRVATLENN